ncbi:TetR family transcriptional regulator [Tsukamurella soli]|uniref:TetR family transcriptional regulator n=1 Tax=Tsukamurella soli TaxID=644556 RepID=UPI0031E7BC44
MSEQVSFQVEMRLLLRERILDAARELVVASGWSAVNMSQVARRVGVSRPALYNEIGNRQDLATALIEHETDHFLEGIVGVLADNPDDPVDGLAAAARFTLVEGGDNTLLRTILAGEHRSEDGLLPLVTAEPEPVLGRAIDSVSGALRAQYGDIVAPPLARVLDEVFVRLTLSHLLQPRGSVDDAVAQIRQVVAGLAAAPG